MTEVSVKEKPVEAAKKSAPATSVTVPVVPTLVTVGNIAVTSSALAVSSGVAGPIVAVVAAATGLAMIRHHKSKRPGAKTFGTKRSAIRSSRSGGGRPSAAGRLGKGLAGRAAGRLGSKLGRLGKGLTGRAGGSLSNSRIGRAARRAGKALSPVGRAMRGASRGVDKAFRGAGAGLSKAGRAAGKVGRFARRVVRPGELERARRKRDIDAQRDRKYNRKNVGPKVNEPPKLTNDPKKPKNPSVKPKKDIPVAKGNGPTGNKGPSLNGSQLAKLTKVFTAQVQDVRHRGHLETLAEAQDLPAVISMVSEALRARVAEYTRASIHPDYVQALATICAGMDSLSNMSRQLPEIFVDLHKDLIGNLVNSPAPEAWDTSNNGV